MGRAGTGWTREGDLQRFVRAEVKGKTAVITAAGSRLTDKPGRLVGAERDSVLTQNYFVPSSVGSRLPMLLSLLARDNENPRPPAFQACELAPGPEREQQRHIGLFLHDRNELERRFKDPVCEGRLEAVVAWPSALLALIERCDPGPRQGLEVAIEIGDNQRFSAAVLRDGAPLVFHEGWLERPEEEAESQPEDALDLVEDSIYKRASARSFTRPERSMFRDAEEWRQKQPEQAEQTPFLIVDDSGAEGERVQPSDEQALPLPLSHRDARYDPIVATAEELDPFELSDDAMLQIDPELVAQSLERQARLEEHRAADLDPSASAVELGWTELMDLADRSGEVHSSLDRESAVVFDAVRTALGCAEDVTFEDLPPPQRILLFGDWRGFGVNLEGLSAVGGCEVRPCSVAPLLEGAGLPPGSEPERYAIACGLALQACRPGPVLGGLSPTPRAERVRLRAQKGFFLAGLALSLLLIAYGALTDHLSLKRRTADSAQLQRTTLAYREQARKQAGIKQGLLKSSVNLLTLARAARASRSFPDTMARVLAALPESVQPILIEARAGRSEDLSRAQAARFAPQPPQALRLELAIRIDEGEGEDLQRLFAALEALRGQLAADLKGWELAVEDSKAIAARPLVYHVTAELRQQREEPANPAPIGGAR